MSTTADKIEAALSSKADIRAALEEKIGSDPGGVFSEYAPIIRSLGTGTVKSVNNIGPDDQGNVQLSARDLDISAIVEGETLVLSI